MAERPLLPNQSGIQPGGAMSQTPRLAVLGFEQVLAVEVGLGRRHELHLEAGLAEARLEDWAMRGAGSFVE